MTETYGTQIKEIEKLRGIQEKKVMESGRVDKERATKANTMQAGNEALFLSCSLI